MEGGFRLHQDRLDLPILQFSEDEEEEEDESMMRSSPRKVRCPTGYAVVTGPNDYHKLYVPFVIHAVGPNYWDFQGQTNAAHQFLVSAYHQSLDRAAEQDIQCVGFSLLSAGVFRARVPLLEILEVTMYAIQTWVPESVKDKPDDETEPSKVAEPTTPTQPTLLDVTLCGFNKEECQTLVEACNRIFRPTPTQDSPQSKKAKPDESDKEDALAEADEQDAASTINAKKTASALAVDEAVDCMDNAVAGAELLDHTANTVAETTDKKMTDEEWEVVLEMDADNVNPIGPAEFGSDDDSL